MADGRWWLDRYNYLAEDFDIILDWVKQTPLDCLLTTENYTVKLMSLRTDWPVFILVLGIEIRFLNDVQKILEELIGTMLRDHNWPSR